MSWIEDERWFPAATERMAACTRKDHAEWANALSGLIGQHLGSASSRSRNRTLAPGDD